MATSAIFGSAIYGDSLYSVIYVQGNTNLNFQTESSVKGNTNLVGASSLTFDDNATLTSRARIQASSTLVFTPQSILKGRGRIQGDILAPIFATNNPIVLGRGRVQGNTSLDFIGEGYLKTTNPIQASSTLVFTPQGDILYKKLAKGSTELKFALSALSRGFARSLANSTLIFDNEAIVYADANSSMESNFRFSGDAKLLATANSPMDSIIKFNSDTILSGYGRLPSAFSDITFGYEATLNKARLRAPAVSVTFNVSADELNYTTTLPWYNTIGKNRLPYDNSNISTLLPLYIDTVGTNRLPYQNTKKEAV